MIGNPLPLVSVTRAQRRVLRYVADGMRHFDGAASGRTHRRAHVTHYREHTPPRGPEATDG